MSDVEIPHHVQIDPSSDSKFEYTYKCGCSIIWTKADKLRITHLCDYHNLINPPNE